MKSPRRRWEATVSKILHRRSSQNNTRLSLEPSGDIDEQKDGFYMYSVEEETKRLEAMKLEKGSESSEGSFSSAVMTPLESLVQPVESDDDPVETEALVEAPAETSAETEVPVETPVETSSEALIETEAPVETEVPVETPVETPVERLPPYTIDSPDWEQPGVLADDDTRDVNGQDKLSSIMAIFSKVYSVAKVVKVSFIGFDIDTDNFPTGLSFHIGRAESVVKSTSLSQLKETVENLYYSVYARLIVEMANIELCSSFAADVRHMSANDFLALPEPSQMYKIFLSCKEILDSSSVRSHLNANTIRVCQESFFNRMAVRLSNANFTYDNYGEYIVNEVSNDQSAFCRKWLCLAAVYRMPSAQTLALLSEKYLAIIPKASVPEEIPISDLPFINPNTIDPAVWERQIIHDNRQATLAKLEGKSIGDIRRDESPHLFEFARERKCVCPSACTCAYDCTNDVERPCPCAPRMFCIMLVQYCRDPNALPFPARCSGLAKAIFDGLAVINRGLSDIEMVEELGRSLQLIEGEIRKERGS